jgi:NitT/TauT family transport system substrate-binding protein
MQQNGPTLTAYMKVLVESAKQFYDDFDSAVSDLQSIYGAPKEILQVALRRQAPNPVIRDAGSSGIKGATKYLVELGYLKNNIADDVLALHLQPS